MFQTDTSLTLREAFAYLILSSVLESFPSSSESLWLLECSYTSTPPSQQAFQSDCFQQQANWSPAFSERQRDFLLSNSLLEGLVESFVAHAPACKTFQIATRLEEDSWPQIQRLYARSRNEGFPQIVCHPFAKDWYQWCYEWMFLGVARAPGVMALGVQEEDSIARLEILIETALLRKMWVVLLSKTPLPNHIRRRFSTRFQSVAARMRLPMEHLEASRPFRQDEALDAWVLAPHVDSMESCRSLLHQSWNSLLQVQQQRFDSRFHAMGSTSIRRESLPLTLKGEKEEIEVVRAEEGDLLEVIELWEALMDEHTAWDPHFQRHSKARQHLMHSLRQQVHQPESCLLVARTPRLVVGFVSAQHVRSPLFAEARSGHLLDLYVDVDARRWGVGTALVTACLRWFQQQQIQRVELNVARLNPVGQKFWKKMGFVPYLNVLSRHLEQDGDPV
jgi:ribosomal protein S18 acetylase RimI-like enzyme